MTEPEPNSEPTVPNGQILIYRDGTLNLQVRLDGQTVWLSQRLMAGLYQVSVPTINGISRTFMKVANWMP
jgi:hypothetical protein